MRDAVEREDHEEAGDGERGEEHARGLGSASEVAEGERDEQQMVEQGAVAVAVPPEAEVRPGEALQKDSIPRGKRGVWNSVQGSGSARLGRAARLFRFLPAADAAERGGI